MIFFRRQVLLYVFKAFDLSIVFFSFAIATIVSRYPIPVEKSLLIIKNIFSMQLRLNWVVLLLGFLLIWHITFNILGLYRSMRFSPRSIEIKGVLKATSFGSLVMIGAAFLFELVHKRPLTKFAGCVTPEEVGLSHSLFTAALESQRTGQTIPVQA